jgi:hypothetical protein
VQAGPGPMGGRVFARIPLGRVAEPVR